MEKTTEANTYLDRLSLLIAHGVARGAIYGFWSSVIYIAVLFSVMFFLPLFIVLTPYHNLSFMVSNFFISIIFVTIPATIVSIIIGIADGVVVVIILAIWKKKIRNIFASFIGLTVTAILVLIINYLAWHDLHIHRQAYYPFWDFIFPKNVDDLVDFITGKNIYFIHSLIAIFLSTFGTWQINRIYSSQRTG